MWADTTGRRTAATEEEQTCASEQAVKSNRIAQAKEIAWRSVGESKPYVKIDLLSSGKPISTAGVDDLARPAVVRVIANVFDKQVGVGADFPLDDKRRFGDRIALRLTGEPELCEHTTETPAACDLSRPRKLDIRIITVTRDPARPGGEAQTGCRGQHNTARKRSKLRFDGGREVRKASRAPTVNGAEIVG